MILAEKKYEQVMGENKMKEQMKFNSLGVMLDCSRNAVMKPERVKEYIDIMADLGYSRLMLYTEDTYEIKGRPYFGHNRGKYSIEELKDLDAYGKARGIELIPCIQTLAHVNAIFHWPEFDSIHDCDDILLAGEDETYALVEEMFASVNEAFSSKIVNIGMDEAHMLGRGKYQDLHGFENRFDILLRHLQKVSEIAKKYDYELLMWGDMFFRILNAASGGGYYDTPADVPEEVKAMIPENVTLVYWDYYSVEQEHYEKNIRSHARIKDNIWFTGGLWCWSGFAPHNAYSMNAVKAAFAACETQGVQDIILALWGDNGGECSRFAMLPSLYYASELAKGNEDLAKIKQGFEEKYGYSFDEFCLLDMPLSSDKEKEPVGAEKYFLYNDCFMGLFDSIMQEDYQTIFADTAEKLSKHNQKADRDTRFDVLFEAMEKLFRANAIKSTLGLRTRAAYASSDKQELADLISAYDETVDAVREFYDAYEKLWMWENKPHGFDVQDVRLGGLITRIIHCRKRLKQYLDGEIDKIEELEEPLLDINCRNDNKELVGYNNWDKTVTSNVL